MSNEDREMMEDLVDVAGEHFESFFAMLFTLAPDNLGEFGVMNGLEIAGEQYRYQVIVAREGKDAFDQIDEAMNEQGVKQE